MSYGRNDSYTLLYVSDLGAVEEIPVGSARDSLQLLIGKLNALLAGKGDEVLRGLARVAARQPDGWVQAEDGVFIGRPSCPARIAWLVDEQLKQEYVRDPHLLADHLRQVGFTALDGSQLACLCDMAATPFKMWIELDVLADGSVGDSLGADYYFSSPVLNRSRPSFAEGAPATHAMEALQARSLIDERWRLLADATTATLVPLNSEEGGYSAFLMRIEPTFVKAKWVPGKTPLAKVYQIVDVKLLGR